MVKRIPEILIFDVDGVLVDVRESFHRSILDTIEHFTGRRMTFAQIHRWKNRSGYNDDWKLTTDWLAELGRPLAYARVKRQFQKFYWGTNGGGNVARERWLVPRGRLRRWAESAELAIFTGRTRRELRYTLEHCGTADCFRRMVTMDDVERLKPDPEGLLRILAGRQPSLALYLGDHLDDAQAARRAGIPFIGILPRNSEARRLRAGKLRKLGARIILDNVNELERLWR